MTTASAQDALAVGSIMPTSTSVGAYMRGGLLKLFTRLSPSVIVMDARFAPPISPLAPPNTVTPITYRRRALATVLTENEVLVKFQAVLPFKPDGSVPLADGDTLTAALIAQFTLPPSSLVEMQTSIAVIAVAAGVSASTLSIRGDSNSVTPAAPSGSGAGAAAPPPPNVAAIAGGVGGGVALIVCGGLIGFTLMQNGKRRKTGVISKNDTMATKSVVNPLVKTPTTSTNSIPAGLELVRVSSPLASARKMVPPNGSSSSSAAAAATEKEDVWEQVQDGGDIYFMNKRTGELSWSLPSTAAVTPTAIIPPPPLPYVVILDGEDEFYRLPSGESVWVRPSDVLIPLWERVEADNGDVWYRHTNTGEVSWTDPTVVPMSHLEATTAATAGAGGGSAPVDTNLWDRRTDSEACWYVNVADENITVWELPQNATLLTYTEQSDGEATWYETSIGTLVWVIPEGAIKI